MHVKNVQSSQEQENIHQYSACAGSQVISHSTTWIFAAPWTVALQVPLPGGVFQQRDKISSPTVFLAQIPCGCLRKQDIFQFSSVQSLSHVRIFVTPWIAAHQASLSITNSRSLLRLTSIKSVMPSSPLILCRPLLLLPPIPPSIRVFSNESTLRMRWPKYWSFSFSIISSKEIPGLIFRMDWLDLLAIQGTLYFILFFILFNFN